MSAVLAVHGLRVRRSPSVVVEVDDLEVPSGEVLALVGPNGGGKTTLLLAIAHLLGIQNGEIRFKGRDQSEWNALEYRRHISLVFQTPLLLDMSVEDNVALGLRFRGIPDAEAKTRVHDWLERLGIGSLASRPARELSGGEAQRVSIARAFVLDPELLLLDEPFPALDPPAREKLLQDLSALLSHNHRTALLVTHNLAEAARLGDRVGVFIGGRLRQVGRPAEVKRHPADRDVADFLRSMPQ
jgi:tungstate transport system ATP-binding protein